MKKLFKILIPLLALVLLAVFVLRPSQPSEVQQEPTSEQEIIQEMVQTYSRGGDPETVDALLAQLEETNAAAAKTSKRCTTISSKRTAQDLFTTSQSGTTSKPTVTLRTSIR